MQFPPNFAVTFLLFLWWYKYFLQKKETQLKRTSLRWMFISRIKTQHLFYVFCCNVFLLYNWRWFKFIVKIYGNKPPCLKYCQNQTTKSVAVWGKELVMIIRWFFFHRLKHKDVFLLINKYNLFEAVSEKTEQLMEFDLDNAVKMLMDNVQKIPVCNYGFITFHLLASVTIYRIIHFAGI